MARPKQNDNIRSVIELLCIMEDVSTKEEKMIFLKKVAQILFEQEVVKEKVARKKRKPRQKDNNQA